MRDLLQAYTQGREGQVKEECERAYRRLVKSRDTAGKVVVPLALLVAVTSWKNRSIWQISRNMAIMIGGGMTINEILQWNSLSAKLYLLQKNLD